MTAKEFISTYRVFPRLYVVVFFAICIKVINWFIALDAPSPEQAAFTTILSTGLVALVKYYSDSGVKKHEINCKHDATH